MKQSNVVGVDTHKDTLACYKQGDFKEFRTNTKGFEQALKWAGDAKWAVEGAYCFGRPFCAFLIKNGHDVFEVNPLLTKTWRGVISISNPKNDYGDAKVISLFANTSNLQKISLETVALKEKLTTRKLVVKQKTEITNSLKMLFSIRGGELPFKDLTTQKALKWLEKQEDVIIKCQTQILKSLIYSMKELEKQIEESLPKKTMVLKQLKGLSTIGIATIYTETKGKLLTSGKLASYAGIAPVESASGRKSKFRNNKTGNRNLNCIFYRLSLFQSRFEGKGKEYYEKKIQEGKSPRHARKCLARQLVNLVFKMLKD